MSKNADIDVVQKQFESSEGAEINNWGYTLHQKVLTVITGTVFLHNFIWVASS